MRPFMVLLEIAFAMLFAGVIASPSRAQISVVNMIPKEWSWETVHNGEPHLAHNRAFRRSLAASAWMPDQSFCTSLLRPLFRSYSGGKTWQTYCALPVHEYDSQAGDITLAFSPQGGRLYAAYLSPIGGENGGPALGMRVARVNSVRGILGTPLTRIHEHDGGDHPSIQVTRVGGHDYAYVGNFYPFGPSTVSSAYVDVLPRANVGSAGSGMFNGSIQVDINKRDVGYDPTTRLAAHPDGTLFAIFYRGYSSDNTGMKFDVVVAAATAGTSTFDAISEESNPEGGECHNTDDYAGVRVAQCVSVLFDETGAFGFQRLTRMDLAIAVDPSTPKPEIIYAAWADGMNLDNYTVHVRRSTTGGLSWEDTDLRTIRSATNPALAVDKDGTVGLLYQEFAKSCDGATDRWITKIELSKDGFDTKPMSYVLANVSATAPNPQGNPYVGDYLSLQADGGRFYGVFSTSNEPTPTNFPQGVTYQRNVDWGSKILLDVSGADSVHVSLDPFFFTFKTSEAIGCSALRTAQSRTALLAGRGNTFASVSRAVACRVAVERGASILAGSQLIDFSSLLTSIGC